MNINIYKCIINFTNFVSTTIPFVINVAGDFAKPPGPATALLHQKQNR